MYYAPYRDAIDGRLSVCSDCGCIVPLGITELHDEFHDRILAAAQERTVIVDDVITDPVATYAENRNTLWNEAVKADIIRPRLTASGRQSYMYECSVCGRQGTGAFGSWWVDCAKEHPFKCSCGRRFSTLSSQSAHIRSQKGKTHVDHFPVGRLV